MRGSAVSLAATGQRQFEPNTMGVAASFEALPKSESQTHRTWRAR